MMTYMYFFFFNILLYIYDLGIKEYYKKESKILKKIAILMAFLFLVLRFGNGWDYMAYYNTIFYNLHTNIVDRGEFLTVFLVEISKKFQIPFLFFFVNSIIQLYCVSKTIFKYSESFWVSFFFYISFPLFFLNSFSVIRMFTAVALIFFGYHFLEEKKTLKYLCLVIIASGFHQSALLALFFLAIPYIKKINVAFYLLGIPIIRFIAYEIANWKFNEYLVYFNNTNVEEGTKAIYVFMFIYLLCIFFFNKIKENNKLLLQVNIFSIGFVIYCSFLGMGTLSHRLSLFGTIFSVLLVATFFEMVPKKYKKILMLLYLFICVVMFIYTLNAGRETYIPYKTIFSTS
ncbi:EpsG family protein [Vagococcus fluvialis]|uniref:EpsG family protein n=1 Tax=Vagococcus fluvialis TaxID=2738 RepID=UPI0032E43130